MMIKKVVLITLLLPVSVAAQELSTDRPDQTEAPFVVPFRTIQIECGFLHRNEKSGKSTELPSILWRLSLSEIMEMRIITTHLKNRTGEWKENGITPVEIGFKIKVCDEKGIRPQIGFIHHLVLHRIASENFKANNYATNFRFAVQHNLSDKVNLSYNAGMEWEPYRSTGNFVYTLTSSFGMTDKLSVYVEIFGTIPEQESNIHSFDGGMAFLLFPNLQLDVSAGADFKNPSENYFISSGISWRFSTRKYSN